MDTVSRYREIARSVLAEHVDAETTTHPIETKLIESQDDLLLLAVGWQQHRRVHGVLAHVSFRNGKVWVEQDNLEGGVADRLVEAGVPHDQIVLGLQPVEFRPLTEFASA